MPRFKKKAALVDTAQVKLKKDKKNKKSKKASKTDGMMDEHPDAFGEYGIASGSTVPPTTPTAQKPTLSEVLDTQLGGPCWGYPRAIKRFFKTLWIAVSRQCQTWLNAAYFMCHYDAIPVDDINVQ